MSTKKETICNLLLAQLEKLELEEAADTNSIVKKVRNYALNTPSTGLTGLDAPEIRTKKSSGSKVSDFLQNTKDAYAKQNVVPDLINTGLMKHFGQMTTDQQFDLQNQAAKPSAQLKEVNWTQYFYNSDILRQKKVRLYTFLKRLPKEALEKEASTVESFYTNYATSNVALFEEMISTTVGDREGNSIFLNSAEETRAYVKADLDSNLYIGASSRGPRYLEFTQGHVSAINEESRKIINFSSNILEEVKQKAISKLDSIFTGDSEKELLATIKNNNLPQVLLDSLMFGLVDTLNFPSTKDYGTGHQAGSALLGNPLLSESLGDFNLSKKNPALVQNIKENLTACISQTNPYLKNISRLFDVMGKARPKNTIYNSLTNVILGNFGNLVAKLAAICGSSNFDFTSIFNGTNPREKIERIIELGENDFYTSFSKSDTNLPNPFIRITFTKASLDYDKSKEAYLLFPENVNGINWKGDSGEVYSATSNWHGLGIPLDMHEFILKQAEHDFQNISAAAYLSTFSSLGKKSDTSQNAYAGGPENATSEQFQEFLASIYTNGEFNTNFVVFAIIPRIFFQYSKYFKGFKSSRRKFLNIRNYGSTKNNLFQQHMITTVDSVYYPVNPIISEIVEAMEPIELMRDEILSKMYDINTSPAVIEDLKQSFIVLVTNIMNGYWTSDDFFVINTSNKKDIKQDLGLFNPLNSIGYDLQFDNVLLGTGNENKKLLRVKWEDEQRALPENAGI